MKIRKILTKHSSNDQPHHPSNPTSKYNQRNNHRPRPIRRSNLTQPIRITTPTTPRSIITSTGSSRTVRHRPLYILDQITLDDFECA